MSIDTPPIELHYNVPAKRKFLLSRNLAACFHRRFDLYSSTPVRGAHDGRLMPLPNRRDLAEPEPELRPRKQGFRAARVYPGVALWWLCGCPAPPMAGCVILRCDTVGGAGRGTTSPKSFNKSGSFEPCLPDARRRPDSAREHNRSPQPTQEDRRIQTQCGARDKHRHWCGGLWQTAPQKTQTIMTPLIEVAPRAAGFARIAGAVQGASAYATAGGTGAGGLIPNCETSRRATRLGVSLVLAD
jgi:hypothetical protein